MMDAKLKAEYEKGLEFAIGVKYAGLRRRFGLTAFIQGWWGRVDYSYPATCPYADKRLARKWKVGRRACALFESERLKESGDNARADEIIETFNRPFWAKFD